MNTDSTAVITPSTSFFQWVAPDTSWTTHGEIPLFQTNTLYTKPLMASGREGILPSNSGLFSYNVSSGVFLLVAVLYVYLFFRFGALFQKNLKSLFTSRQERQLLFISEITTEDVKFSLFARILGILGLVVFTYSVVYKYFIGYQTLEALLLMGAIGVGLMVMFASKYLYFKLFDYVFFRKDYSKPFLTTYFSIIFSCGFILFPLVILQTFASEQFIQPLQFICISICILANLLILVRSLQFFLHSSSSIFYIILYLCTLEILPVMITIRLVEGLSISV